jgi:drug/metabolite transporter (DMT)-like permease
VPPDRKPVDALAFGLMFTLCVLWGFQQVTIKVAAADISLLMQAGIRSILATALLLLWSRWRGIALFSRDGTLLAGLAAGAMFAGEFGFIYAGLAHTSASRMVVFLYLAPCMTALLLAAFVPGERLTALQWGGVLLAFLGVVAAFRDGLAGSGSGTTWRGDLFGVIAALLWALTTLVIRTTKLGRASAEKTLFYQVAAAAVTLPIASFILGEPGIIRVTPLAIAIIVYQGAVVAFASFLAWFWLLTRYRAAQLSVFGFLTPLFGVLFGVVLLGERMSPAFVAAAALVVAGIALVAGGGARRAAGVKPR